MIFLSHCAGTHLRADMRTPLTITMRGENEMRKKRESFVTHIAEDLDSIRKKLLDWDRAVSCRHRDGCNHHGQCCDLIEQANSIILLMDPGGVIFFVNDYAERFFGYEHGALIGKNIVGSIVPAHESTGRDLGMLIRDIALHPDQYVNNVNENMRCSGERVWVSWTNRAITDEHGAVTEIICVGNDITARKLMEDALRKSEQRYHCLFESSLDPIVLLCRDGRVRDVNPAALGMFGYTRGEAAGMFIGEIFVSADEYRDIRDQLRTYAVAHDYEIHLRKRDGTELTCLVSVTVRHHCSDEDRCFQVFIHDITIQRQMESAIRESERKLSIVINSISDIVYRLDPDGIISFISPSIRTYGYEPDELIGKSILELVHADDHARIKHRLQERRTGERRTRALEIRLVTKSRKSLPFEISSKSVELAPVFLVEAAGLYRDGQVHSDNYMGTQGVARDITERKRAERALQESETRFRTLFESESHAVLLIDRERNLIVDVNTAGTAMYGYSREEFLDLPPSAVWAEESDGETVDTEPSGNRPFQNHRKKDGTVFPVQVSGGTIEILGRELFLCTVRDVSDRLKAQEETLRREKLEGVLEMAQAVCHEINQPLQILSGYTEIISQGRGSPEATSKYFDEITKAVGRVREVTRKLNTITRYETMPYLGDKKIIDIDRSSEK